MLFQLVSLLVHSVELLPFLIRPGDPIVYLLVVWNLVLLVFLVVLRAKELLEPLFSFHIGRPLVEQSRLNDDLIESHLVLRLAKDVLFDLRVGDQPEHPHFVLLADTIGPILRLQVHHRVPVAVKNDDCVGRLKVETQATGSC